MWDRAVDSGFYCWGSCELGNEHVDSVKMRLWILWNPVGQGELAVCATCMADKSYEDARSTGRKIGHWTATGYHRQLLRPLTLTLQTLKYIFSKFHVGFRPIATISFSLLQHWQISSKTEFPQITVFWPEYQCFYYQIDLPKLPTNTLVNR